MNAAEESRSPKALIDAKRELDEARAEAMCCDDIVLNQSLAGIIADLQADRERLRPKREASETGWLVELVGSAPTEYAVLTDDMDEHWTTDSIKALRFARREDAQAYIQYYGWTEAIPVEHEWVPPAIKPTPRGGVEPDWWAVSVKQRRSIRHMLAALRQAKRLTDNINEFGACTDSEIYDAAWQAIEAAITKATAPAA